MGTSCCGGNIIYEQNTTNIDIDNNRQATTDFAENKGDCDLRPRAGIWQNICMYVERKQRLGAFSRFKTEYNTQSDETLKCPTEYQATLRSVA